MITKDDILNTVSPAILATKDEAAIAAALSVGRTKLQEKRIGVGTIIETLGITAGNAFLDTIFAASEFRYVKLLIERGELNVGSEIVQTTIDSLVPSILTSAEAGKLKALGIVDAPVSAYEVALALSKG